MTITLFAAAIIGLIALLFITKNLRSIVRTVRDFNGGTIRRGFSLHLRVN